MNNASIDYSISCTSEVMGLSSTTHDFPGRFAKPSDVIKELLVARKYGLGTVFSGMTNIHKVLENNLIASNDKKVKLLPQKNVTVLTYINYLVSCMINVNTINENLTTSKYFLSIHDDTMNNVGGTYFKVEEVSKFTNTINSFDTYEVDVNFPSDNFVTQFSLQNDQSWALLYNYNQTVRQDDYSYDIDDNGNVVTTYAPALLRSSVNGEISPTKTSWWTQMTEFPISGTLTIKGLTRPSMLMSYVKINVWFNGGIKHISSGLYIITKQTDTIDSTGYKTTLSVLRVGGDT